MKTSFVSNLAVQNAMRLTLQQSQLELMKLQQEMTTGVYADTGTALGSTTSRSINLRTELDRLKNIKDTNALATQRLSASQGALTTMRDSVQQIRSQLISAKGTEDKGKLDTAHTTFVNQMSAFTAAANTQFNNEYVFSGINSDVRPLTDYSAGSPAKAAYDTALANFQAANGNVQLKDFTPAQMNDFIKNSLEPMFLGSGWQGTWSQASDQNIQTRIGPSEVIETSSNTNTTGVRQFMMAAVISLELMKPELSTAARDTALSAAQDHLESGLTGIIQMGAQIGVSEGRIKSSNSSIDNQVKLINTHILDIEGVDPTETSSRLTALKTQIEISYTLTARIQELSLINYL
ncbi:flagellar hook-associated family protein [Rhizobium sp. YIM 134829]|uniref:flagellar hook-associated family protein n=1 Tax=Rhizobium sp. YIM 134829 TaxID=3390453 RepID=UPI003978C93F